MDIKETIRTIRKKYRELADAECNTVFSDYYCKQFDTQYVGKSTDKIQIDQYEVTDIVIDHYNNMNCKCGFMPVEYLRPFRVIFNSHFDKEDHSYYLRVGSHFFINYFRQNRDKIDDDYLAVMLQMDDHMPKETGGNHFREWLLGRNNNGCGELRYNPKPKLLKNLVQTKEGWTWERPKDNCEICHGESGGVKGNESIVNGKVVCDYCSVKMQEMS
jgi:hypothetical protein